MTTQAPNIKRLVDLVDRDQVDETFYPPFSQNTIFYRRPQRAYHNMIPEIVEIGYQGNAAWGQRITIALTRKDSGDMLQWLCLRIAPRSWLGPDLDAKIQSGLWNYQNPANAWTWTASLGTAAIQQVEFEIGDAVVEKWGGEWMDVWSRMWMDGGRSGTWDADIFGQRQGPQMNDRSFTQPTEDGYIYCWLPLALLRRTQTAFPLVAMGEQEVRIHITLRPFSEVVRRVGVLKSQPNEVPLGETITLLDNTGTLPIPRTFVLPSGVPSFEDATVLVGVAHMEDPLRRQYLHLPMEIMYEPVFHSVFQVPPGLVHTFPLQELCGPIRELCFVLRCNYAWQTADWTNYGNDGALTSARLMVGNAVWRDEAEEWWRLDYGLAHRGGVRLYGGNVYGIIFGSAADWTAESMQPAGTVNASRADLRLDLTFATSPCNLELHVFGIGLNWMRFAKGMAVPLFRE